MAEGAVTKVDGAVDAVVERHDLKSFLFDEERDFLFRNNGDQVLISSLMILFLCS